MIREYTTLPLYEHDADYPWYRPGYMPENTCGYPYQFPYFNAYPTYTVTTTNHLHDCRCNACLEKHHHHEHNHGHKHHEHKDKEHKKNKKNTTLNNITTVLLILTGVYISAKLLLPR